MRDFVLDDAFIPSCLELPEDIREKVVSQLQAFTKDSRDRNLGIERVEGSRHSLSFPIDDTHRIVLRREKKVNTLLFVTENNSQSTLVLPPRGSRGNPIVVAPVEALKTLLVEGKYLLLAKHLLRVPAATKELQFQIPEIERILNA